MTSDKTLDFEILNSGLSLYVTRQLNIQAGDVAGLHRCWIFRRVSWMESGGYNRVVVSPNGGLGNYLCLG